jgi:hypothetical protein
LAWTTAGSLAQGTAATLAVTNTTIGDVRVVWTGSSSGSPVISAGGVTTWNTVVYTGATETAADLVIAWGVITATGSQTVSATHTPFDISSQEFVPPGAAPTLDTSGHLSGTTTGATVAGVSLTGTAGDLWASYSACINATTAGTTSGVVYHTTTPGNCLAWHLNAPAGAFAPNWDQTGAWDTLGMMLISTGGTPAFAPKGVVATQARNRAGTF